MADTRFAKMHGAGNDFLILDERTDGLGLSPARVMALADRRRGIGCDQLIVLRRSDRADVAMRIYNPDGSESGACGNAARCVAALECLRLGRRAMAIETAAGLLPAWLNEKGLNEKGLDEKALDDKGLDDGAVCVDMGAPSLGWQDVPLARACDTLHLPLAGDPAALSMGNPHATLFVEDVDATDVAGSGAALERDPLFPDRANIGFAQIMAPGRIRLRVWERGAGPTLACGSGACAALVNAHRRGLSGHRADVEMDGGTLHILWREADSHVLMTGPAVTAFHGTVDLSTYPG